MRQAATAPASLGWSYSTASAFCCCFCCNSDCFCLREKRRRTQSYCCCCRLAGVIYIASLAQRSGVCAYLIGAPISILYTASPASPPAPVWHYQSSKIQIGHHRYKYGGACSVTIEKHHCSVCCHSLRCPMIHKTGRKMLELSQGRGNDYLCHGCIISW